MSSSRIVLMINVKCVFLDDNKQVTWKLPRGKLPPGKFPSK